MEGNDESVYYDGGFAVFVKADVDLDRLMAELGSAIGNKSGWILQERAETEGMNYMHWSTPDGYEVVIDVNESDDTDEVTLNVSATSPCFTPEPLYERGDKL